MSLRLPAALAAAALLAGCARGPKAPLRAADFDLPACALVDQDGAPVQLAPRFPAGEPVVVSFLFTTCTTECPQVAAGFASLQARLGGRAARVRLVAFSLDPAHDTPPAMRAFLDRFRAQPGWVFYTGADADLRRVRHAFMDQVPGEGPLMPLTFLRSPKDQRWIRISGRKGPAEFLEICQQEGLL